MQLATSQAGVSAQLSYGLIFLIELKTTDNGEKN